MHRDDSSRRAVTLERRFVEALRQWLEFQVHHAVDAVDSLHAQVVYGSEAVEIVYRRPGDTVGGMWRYTYGGGFMSLIEEVSASEELDPLDTD